MNWAVLDKSMGFDILFDELYNDDGELYLRLSWNEKNDTEMEEGSFLWIEQVASYFDWKKGTPVKFCKKQNSDFNMYLFQVRKHIFADYLIDEDGLLYRQENVLDNEGEWQRAYVLVKCEYNIYLLL